jgi:hypothetical protein
MVAMFHPYGTCDLLVIGIFANVEYVPSFLEDAKGVAKVKVN